MLHDTLWRLNLDLAQSCLAHPFVQALGCGTLKADLFRAFIAQDAYFLRAFLKAYALALARSDETESIALFYELMGGVLEELAVLDRTVHAHQVLEEDSPCAEGQVADLGVPHLPGR